MTLAAGTILAPLTSGASRRMNDLPHCINTRFVLLSRGRQIESYKGGEGPLEKRVVATNKERLQHYKDV